MVVVVERVVVGRRVVVVVGGRVVGGRVVVVVVLVVVGRHAAGIGTHRKICAHAIAIEFHFEPSAQGWQTTLLPLQTR